MRKLLKFSFPLCNENLNSFLTRWGNYSRRGNYSREETNSSTENASKSLKSSVRFVCFGVCLFWNFNPSKAWNFNTSKACTFIWHIRVSTFGVYLKIGKANLAHNPKNNWTCPEFCLKKEKTTRKRKENWNQEPEIWIIYKLKTCQMNWYSKCSATSKSTIF